MASPKKRGRPTNAEIMARGGAQAAVEVTISVVVPMKGISCPACGKAMVPRIQRTRGNSRFVACCLCPANMVIDYTADGQPKTVRLI